MTCCAMMTNPYILARRSILVLAGALLASGCGPAYTIVRQGNPNPFTGRNAFIVEAIHYDGLTVGRKTEAEYLAAKKPEQVQSFQGDKSGMVQKFVEVLATQSGVQ